MSGREWAPYEDGTVEYRVQPELRVEWGSDEYVPVEHVAVHDYEVLDNKPQIDGVTLTGNKTAEELGVMPIRNAAILDLFR